MNTSFILIDGSYYVFYRYYAILQWWNHQDDNFKKEEHLFNEKFTEMFIKKIKEIPKKLKITGKYKVIVALDCPRCEIWRNTFYDKYKATRQNDNTGVKNSFKLVMSHNLFEQAEVDSILSCKCLEADDCIALSVKYLQTSFQLTEYKPQIYIITNDHDYLQLKSENISVINLQYKIVGEKKTSGDPQKDLFIKSVCGDKSDNICKIFEFMKIGPKTAPKYFGDEKLTEFTQLCIKEDQKYMDKYGESISIPTYQKYLNNNRLISFDKIPLEYQEMFIDINKSKLDELITI